MKKLLLLALAALAATGLLPMAAASADNLSDEAGFVAEINGLRASKGLSALEVDAGLTGKARAWAQTMADKNMIWHSVLSDGNTADWQRLGENVGMGGTVNALHVAFVNSPHHYDNLVDSGFRSVGIGVVRGAGGTLFVAQEFMQTRAPVVAPVAPPAATPTAVQAPAAVTAAPTAMKSTPMAVSPIAMKTPAVMVVEETPTTNAVVATAKGRARTGGPIGNQRWASAW